MNRVKELFYDPEQGFISLSKLWRKVKANNIDVNYKDVKEFYENQATNQINKQTSKPKVFRTIVAEGPRKNYQADIIIYDRYEMNHYKYILCVVDVYSRYAVAKAMTNRENDTIIKNFKEIFDEMGGPPENINCDNEFNTNKILEYFKEKRMIPHFSDPNEINKNAIVERFNRTIAGLIQKYRVATGDKQWYKVLPKLIKSYNNTYHRTIRETPNDVFNKKVKSRQRNIIRYLPSNLKVGDIVRVKYTKQILGKGDYIRYSQDTYVISKIKGNKYYLDGEDKPFKDLELRQANTIERYEKAQPIDIAKEKSIKTIERSVKKAQKELRDYTTGSEKFKESQEIKGRRKVKSREILDL